jgi:hypothetical protein
VDDFLQGQLVVSQQGEQRKVGQEWNAQSREQPKTALMQGEQTTMEQE